MNIQKISCVIAVLVAGCGRSEPPPQSPPAGEPTTGAPERQAITQEACAAQGGSVVNDIGDGATRRPGYVCPSGKPPLGNITPPAGGPMPIEGAVCCPK